MHLSQGIIEKGVPRVEMNPRPELWAVHEPATAEARLAVDGYLAQARTNATRFAAKDDDELNTGACAGRFTHVLYPDLDSLLMAIWKGDADVRQWLEKGVDLHLAVPPAAAEWRGFVVAMCASLERWRIGQRRRQIIAGVILSALALAASTAIVLLTPA